MAHGEKPAVNHVHDVQRTVVVDDRENGAGDPAAQQVAEQQTAKGDDAHAKSGFIHHEHLILGKDKPRDPEKAPAANEHRRSSNEQTDSCDEKAEEKTAAAVDCELGRVSDDQEDDDPNVVWWDGPDDPENPENWSTWKKTLNCTLVAMLTFLTPLDSSVFAPAVPELMRELHSDSATIAGFVLGIYVLGFALGPLVIAPLSEIYGRNPLYHVCNVFFVAFLAGCALAPNMGALMAFRLLSGIFGSAPMTNGGGTIADMFRQETRGSAMSLFSIGPLLGPIVGPIIGGALAHAAGWRWIFWMLVIVMGALTVAMFFGCSETYAPVILQRKVERLRKETGNPLLRSKLDSGLAPGELMRRSLVRPFKMLARSPLCLILAVYIAIVFGYLYLMFTSITVVFEQTYGFSTATVGLVFCGLGIGNFIGLAYFTVTSDRDLKRMTTQGGGEMKPEYRLRLLPYGAMLFPIGFFIYGWSAQYHVHWIVPIGSHVIIGAAMIIVFFTINTALIDLFTASYAASALAANTVLRSVFGATFPLFGINMYNALGLGWGNSMLAFLALALVPFTFLIIRHGEYLRKRFPVDNL